VAEFKGYPDEWTTLPLDLASAERMGEALSRVSQVKHVPAELARRYGFPDDDGRGASAADDEVEIPAGATRSSISPTRCSSRGW